MNHKSHDSGLYLNTENQSSTSQLTEPPLYSFYGGRNTIDTENQDDFGVDVYRQLTPQNTLNTSTSLVDSSLGENKFVSSLLSIVKTLTFGYTMFYLFNSLHFNNPEIIPILVPMLNSYRFPILFDFNKHTPTTVGINLFLLDFILHSLVSVFPGNTKKNDNSFNKRYTSILQLFVALTGIIYFFKKISWSSKLQADLMFLLINIFYSKYINCSIFEFLSSLILSTIIYLYDNLIIEQSSENSFWRGCFIFFVCVSFIKLKKSDTLL